MVCVCWNYGLRIAFVQVDRLIQCDSDCIGVEKLH